MKARTVAVCAAVLCLTWPWPAAGQGEAGEEGRAPVRTMEASTQPPAGAWPSGPTAGGREPGRPGSFEVSAGAQWLAPGSLGARTATLTQNGSSSPFTYFEASARLAGAAGLDARLSYNLTRRIAVEGGVLFSRPTVELSVARDAEGVPGFTADGEALSQYFLDATVLVFLPQLTFASGRGRAFVQGGAGYLRQLHEGHYSIETGSVYNAGAGLKYYFAARRGGFVKGFGLRVDLRGYYKRGGFSFDGRNTLTPSLGAAAIVAF